MRIGLFAMSGIRVVDAELLEFGLTLPGFVERNKTIAALPSLGLLTLAGMTGDEHEVHYIEVPDIAAMNAPPEGFDLVGISSYSAQIGEAYELARRFKEAGVPVVLGGPHVTALPDEAIEFADAVVVGEGEACWPEVVSDCENGRLAGVYGSVDSGFDLADAPMPAFDLLDISKYNRLTVQTSRGCPHRCEFCGGSVLLTSKYKQKPIAKVLAEINRIFELWEHPFIEFADDNSFVDKAYWRELLGALKGRKFRWFTETDLSIAEDDELLELMRSTGCAQVLIGFESPVEAGLSGLELRGDWKAKRWSRYKDVVRNIQSHGITVNGCFIIGLDGHTPAIFEQVMDFVKDSQLYEVQVTVLTAFPGTPLYDRLKREGRLIEDKRWDKCTLFDINYRPTHMTAEQLVDGFKHFVQELYSEEFTAWRRSNFRRQLRGYVARKGAASDEA